MMRQSIEIHVLENYLQNFQENFVLYQSGVLIKYSGDMS